MHLGDRPHPSRCARPRPAQGAGVARGHGGLAVPKYLAAEPNGVFKQALTAGPEALKPMDGGREAGWRSDVSIHLHVAKVAAVLGGGSGEMQKAEGRMKRDAKSWILEHAVAEWVVKSLTVRHLICTCIGGGYRNASFGI